MGGVSLRERSDGTRLDFLEVSLQVPHDDTERLRGLGIRMFEDERSTESPPMTMRGSSGTRPRNGSPSSFPASSPPPTLKMSVCLPQCGHTKPLMFSITPRMSILTAFAKAIDLRTSRRDTCCGVVTTTAPS